MKRIVGIIFIILLSVSAQAQQLSPKAEISILTLGAGQEALYAAFGHSAIRVRDRENRIDRVYNYGVFDFDQPNFYLNFARGYLNYKLDTVDYPRFQYVYMYYNRAIHEQLLNFDADEKQRFFEYLERNMLPENQYYYYDYFYDNCATRVRDAIINTFGDQVKFDGSYVSTDYTIRELTDIYLKNQPWGDLGIDLCLGLPMDKTATPFMYMFLPDYIESGFEHATLQNGDSTKPLVAKKRVNFSPVPKPSPAKSWFTPSTTFYSLLTFIVLVTLLGFRKKHYSRWVDVVLFIAIGLIGLLLFLLWFATDHHAAARNMNLLWALPTHLVAGILLLKKQRPTWLKHYFLGTAILAIVTLLLWAVLPQLMHYALIPITLILLVRSFWIWRNL